MLRGHLRAEDPGPPLHQVQIELQDPFLPQSSLQPTGHHQLHPLPEERPLGSEVEVLRQLLRQGAPST